MTVMYETEGAFVPKEYRYDLFDLTLWGGDLKFSINVPMYFETDCGVYDSEGVFVVSMKYVFEEYLNGIQKIDAGFNYKELTSYLRDYADRVDAVMEEENTDESMKPIRAVYLEVDGHLVPSSIKEEENKNDNT